MGLSDDELADVTLAAELHEVGKLAIPDSILRKPGPLSGRSGSSSAATR